MMIKGQDAENIAFGNSFTDDAFEGKRFDYLLANPPFGVEWKKVADEIKRGACEARLRWPVRRRAAADQRWQLPVPAAHDLEDEAGRRRAARALAIVFNGSPLFTGAAGSGESEIRRWIIENDWLEAVVALPDQLFYNTGISTYFWVVTNRKSPQRRGKVQLVDAREFFTKMRKSLGEKRKEVSADADRRDRAIVRRLHQERARQDLPERALSGSSESPSSGPCGSGGRSPMRRSPPSTPTRSSPNCSANRSAPPLRAELAGWGDEVLHDQEAGCQTPAGLAGPCRHRRQADRDSRARRPGRP